MIDRIELHALADNEVSAERAAELRQLLRDNPEDLAVYESIVALKRCLSVITPVECSAEWRGAQSRIRELEKSRRVERVVGRYAWSLCGVFFLFILVGGIANRGIIGTRVRSEDIAQMATSLVPTRTPSTRDSEAMNSYLDALLGQARQSLAPDRLQVVAGAVGEVNGHHLARLTVRDAKGDLALIIVPGKLDFVGMPLANVGGYHAHVGSIDGINCIAWSGPSYSAILIGNRPYADLGQTASRVTIQ